MRLIFIFFLLGVSCVAQLPDAPQPNPPNSSFSISGEKYCTVTQFGKTYCDPVRVSFWTFRKHWELPALRSNRQFFRSKVFWIGLGLHAASMTVACSRRNSREDWSSEGPAFGALQTLNYLAGRYFDMAAIPVVDSYAVQRYVRSSLR